MKDLRSSDEFFISYTKRHQAISKDAVSRWSKTVMELSGIDIQKYSNQFTRSAASSKAKYMGIFLKNIIKCAGKQIDKHYDEQIEEEPDICFQ